MIAWLLVAVFGTACVFLVLLGLNERRGQERLLRIRDAVIVDLRAENAKLLATALQAQGQMLIDPAEPPRPLAVRPSTLRSVPQRIRELEEEDRKKAIEKQAQQYDETQRMTKEGDH